MKPKPLTLKMLVRREYLRGLINGSNSEPLPGYYTLQDLNDFYTRYLKDNPGVKKDIKKVKDFIRST